MNVDSGIWERNKFLIEYRKLHSEINSFMFFVFLDKALYGAEFKIVVNFRKVRRGSFLR